MRTCLKAFQVLRNKVSSRMCQMSGARLRGERKDQLFPDYWYAESLPSLCRDPHAPPEDLQHPQRQRHAVPRQLHRGGGRLPRLQGWRAGGLLHLPRHLPGHHLVPLRLHLLLCLAEAEMSQLRGQFHLKGNRRLL